MNCLVLCLLFSLTFMGVIAEDPGSCRKCIDLSAALQSTNNLQRCRKQCWEKVKETGLSCDNKCCNRLCRVEDGFTACKMPKVGFCTVADIRFNKAPCIETSHMASSNEYAGGVHELLFPLLSSDYIPLIEAKAKMLQNETKADSVVIDGDYQLNNSGEDLDHWLSVDPITNATVDPIFPGDADGLFWDQLEAVVETQIAREAGKGASMFYRFPDIWINRSIIVNPWPGASMTRASNHLKLSDVAEAVNGEYPVFHQQSLIKVLLSEGVDFDLDLGQPFRSRNDFVGRPIRMSVINTWSFEAVAPVNFMLKWYFGMPRPEEMAWKIYSDQLTTARDQVPRKLVASIKSMDLKDAHDFTAYKSTGSPFHPSYPAMHSAGSTCSLWLAALCKLTPDQYLEALRLDYAVAMGRTVAGVHYEMDNIVGLNIGQRIVREKLPDFLEKMYDYDREEVAKRLNALSFDWKDFDSEEGTIKGMPVDVFLINAMCGPDSMET